MFPFLRKLGWLFQRNTREADLRDEIDFHLECDADDREAAGQEQARARTEAMREFGNVTLHRENVRSAWGWRFLGELRQDLQFGLRNLKRNPGFAVVAVATLALGIGAATAVFSIVNGVLFEAFPYHDPQRLVLLFERLPSAPGKHGVSPPDYQTIREAARSFAEMAAFSNVEYELSGVAESRRLTAARVSAELFSVLGVAPALGRTITTEDDRQNASVAVLSHRLWSALGRDPSLIGKTVLLDRQPYAVIGVMPPLFEFPSRGAELNGQPAELYVPMSFSKEELEGFGMRYNHSVVARLRPAVSIEQASGEMGAVVAALAERYPPLLQSFVSGLSIPLVQLDEETFGRSRTLLLVLMGAVAIVLLIVCADVANLMLTRFGSRRREVAVRSSLGASRMRIVRQLLTESLTIGLLGCAVGLLFANFAMRALLSFGAETLPRIESISFNPRVLAFAILLALLAPLLFGALPALRSVTAGPAGALRESLRTATPGRKDSRLLAALAVTQVALALVLSVGAGLLVRSFLHLLSTDPGFQPERTVRVTATLPSGGYTTRQQVISFYKRAMEEARAVPGVRAAGVGNFLPLKVRERRAFTAEGGAQPAGGEYRTVSPTWASPGYLEALGVPLKSGRFLRETDGPDQPVVLVNEVLARTAWPGEDPVGRRIKWGIEASRSPWMTVVGVVGDVKQSALEDPAIPQVYVPLPLLEFPSPLARTVNVVARSERDFEGIIAELTEVIGRLDPALPITAQPLDEMIGESLRPRRFSMTVVSVFAIVALTLAAIGIYGVLASLVAQQKHEIAIRVALGATGGRVIWMVLRRTLLLMAAGIGFGVAGALGLTRVMASLLYEVRPTDGITFLAAAVALTLLALLASLAPVLRAMQVGPLTALKGE